MPMGQAYNGRLRPQVRSTPPVSKSTTQQKFLFLSGQGQAPCCPNLEGEAPRPYTWRGRGRGATSSLNRAANRRASTRGKHVTSVSARRTIMWPPSTPPVMSHQEMEIVHHEEMAANVDLVPGDSTSGSGNPTDGRYAQMSIIYPIITNPRECQPDDLRPILPIHQPTILINRTTHRHSINIS